MYYGGKSPEAIQILRKYSQSENTEVLWRLVRACYTVGKFFTKDKTESKQLSDEATGYAKRAVAIDEHNFNTQKVSGVLYSTPYFLPPPRLRSSPVFHTHPPFTLRNWYRFQWMGIALSWSSDFEGTKVKIERSFAIRDHFLVRSSYIRWTNLFIYLFWSKTSLVGVESDRVQSHRCSWTPFDGFVVSTRLRVRCLCHLCVIVNCQVLWCCRSAMVPAEGCSRHICHTSKCNL